MNFNPWRTLIAATIVFGFEPVYAQEPEPAGYNPAKLPRELHFIVRGTHGPNQKTLDVPHLAELGRDVAELRCDEGTVISFIDPEDPEVRIYYCSEGEEMLLMGGDVIRFDLAPSPLPHLRLQTGGMGVTLGCDLGTLQRLFERWPISHKYRCAPE